jgi:predicted membrane protein
MFNTFAVKTSRRPLLTFSHLYMMLYFSVLHKSQKIIHSFKTWSMYILIYFADIVKVLHAYGKAWKYLEKCDVKCKKSLIVCL